MERAEQERRLGRLQRFGVGITALLMLVTLGAVAFEPTPRDSWVTMVAVVAGLLAPVWAYRRYLEAALEADADLSALDQFDRATRRSWWVVAAAAGVGVAAWCYSAAPQALIGVATHVLMIGAIWPTHERFEGFEARGAEES